MLKPKELTDSEKRFLLEDFRTFKPPPGYQGGCIKTRLEGYCYLVRPDGKLGKTQLNCEHWDSCRGEKSKFKI
jgi:hypothetical protein